MLNLTREEKIDTLAALRALQQEFSDVDYIIRLETVIVKLEKSLGINKPTRRWDNDYV